MGLNSVEDSIVHVFLEFLLVIPHGFGMASPLLLDNAELIKTKIEMINNLRKIEISCSRLYEPNNTVESNEHLIHTYYKKLRCNFESVDHNSDESKLIGQHMINTHAKTHNQYILKLREVFKTTRGEEFDCFKKFKKFDNHQLLFYASRTTDFTDILFIKIFRFHHLKHLL
ncbi:unnamed protein product [Rotaria sp. Silwood2]|nr:unnamed protein product [Rotaria sp. Silwood2]